jgi:NitT/TauT family transport system substrate-binding protein
MTLLRCTQIKKLAAAVALAACFALACGGDSKPANRSAPLPIHVGYTASGLTRFNTAVSLKLFEQHGLKVELTRFESGVASAAAFKKGEIDIAITGAPGFARARLSSDAQVFLFEADDADAVSLVVQPGSAIKSPKDLSGKKVGAAIGTNPYVGLVLALKEAGVKPSEVNIVDLAPDIWIPAFQKQEVEALFAWAPYNYRLVASGAKRIATLKSYIPSPIMWMGRAEFLSTPDGAKAAGRFVSAMDEAGRRFKANEDKMLDYIAQQNATPTAIMKSVIADITNLTYAEEVKPTHGWSLTEPDAGFQQVIDRYVTVLTQEGLMKARPGFANAYNPRPLTLYLNSQLG